MEGVVGDGVNADAPPSIVQAKTNEESLKVEDVTDQYEDVYDADAEGQLPDECEEIESDSEDDSKIPANEASLITEFRALHCGTPKPQNFNSVPSTMHITHKRTHGQMLSESDEESMETSRVPTPSLKRPRRRLRLIHDRLASSPPAGTNDVMDVDNAPDPI